MSWSVLPIAAGASALLLAIAFRLRGPGGGRDLTGPPRPEAFDQVEAARLTELILRGEEEEALRQMRAAGHDEAGALKLIAYVKHLGGEAEEAREREG